MVYVLSDIKITKYIKANIIISQYIIMYYLRYEIHKWIKFSESLGSSTAPQVLSDLSIFNTIL